MEITASMGGSAAAGVSPTPAGPPAQTTPGASSSYGPAVTVTLSALAQQVLDGTASAPATSAPAATPPADGGSTPATASSASTATSPDAAAATASTATWSSDAVTQALAALNDTSGAASVSDQISAYALVAKMVADPSNFDPSNSANADAVDVATSFATSAYAVHVQSLMAQTGVYGANGLEDSEAVQQQLNAFSGLSSDDQQSVVAAMNLNSQIEGGPALYASVDSFTANRQAVINVDRAAEAALANPAYANAKPPPSNVNYDARTDQFRALSAAASAAGDASTVALASIAHGVNMNSDAFTAQAAAYFSQYGPPPAATADQAAQDAAPAQTPAAVTPTADQARALFTALTKINDTSGSTSIADQVSAYSSFVANANAAEGLGPLRTALIVGQQKSSFTQRVQADMTAYSGQLLPHGTPGSVVQQTQINNFDKLSSDDQEIIARVYSGQSGGFSSVDDFKANLESKEQIDKLYEGLLSRYGVINYSQITDQSLTNSGAFKALVKLLNTSNQQNDAWTTQAQSVLSQWDQASH